MEERQPHPTPRFSLGKVVVTPGVVADVAHDEILRALSRHVRGDWGIMQREDWEANERALVNEGRLVSVYNTAAKVKFYVITEWDRSVTTVLLPSEY